MSESPQSTATWKGKLRALLHSRRALLYLLLAVGAVYLEHEDEILQGLGRGECDSVTLPVKLLYQRFITLGYRSRSHKVVLVTYLHGISEPCKKRLFVANLINHLANSPVAPTAIAVDHWYDPSSCQEGEGKTESEQLGSVLKDVSDKVPIILGLVTESWEELELHSRLPEKGFTRKDQVLQPSAYSRSCYPNVGFGLVRINCDNRRIPLQWILFPCREAVENLPCKPPEKPACDAEKEIAAKETIGTGRPEGGFPRMAVPSLAYETARRADFRVEAVIAPIIEQGAHPYTSFLPEKAFSPFPDGTPLKATDPGVLCKPVQEGCQPLAREDLMRMRGSVLLLGEDSRADWHDSVLGKVPGYVIQANYINSLLMDSYFRPLPSWVELTLAIIGIVALLAVYECWDILPALGLSLLGLAALGLVCNALGLYFKVFFGFWIPLVPLPFIEALFCLRTRMEERAHHEKK